MKLSKFLAGALAVVAIAGCNSQPGDAAPGAPVDIKPVAPPPGGDWTKIVTATSEGGYMMGNPNAPIKLVEFSSMTCPHCAEFDEAAATPLADNYVKTGQVSWEVRNYVRDAFDVAASLVARCNGEKGFFPMTSALFRDQKNWIAKVQAAPPQQLESLQALPPSQQFLQMAKIAGFQQFATARGVPEAKSTQCLTDENAVNRLVQMTSDASTQFPELPGTPSFVLNGKLLDKTAGWQQLEPQLKTALGERG
jgi:protein-disulfide isomerase